MKKTLYLPLFLFIVACSAPKESVRTPLLNNETFVLTEISTDPTYGLSQKNPIEVGGVDVNQGPTNERRFLNALAGPNGERVTYFRAGSCCPVKSDKGFAGMAMLDNYRVTYAGAKDTVSIYINMYDYGVLKAPMGFTIK